jgi:hypothetical protein
MLSGIRPKLWGGTELRYTEPFQDRFSPPITIINSSTLRGLRQIRRIVRLRQKIQKGKVGGLSDALLLCSGTSATDSRDKVFAFLGMVSTNHTTVPADYTLSTEQVFLRTMQILCRDAINPDSDFQDPLRLSGVGWKRSSKRSVPSWVADWTDISDTILDGFSDRLSTFQVGNYGGSHLKCNIGGRHLLVPAACRIDHITAMTGIINMDVPARITGSDDLWPLLQSRLWFVDICNIVESQLSSFLKLDHHGHIDRDFRRCPGRWRGAIFRTLVANPGSYWGWVPRHHMKPTPTDPDQKPGFERPDTYYIPDLLAWFSAWSDGRLTRRDFYNPDLHDELELAFETWARLPCLIDLHKRGLLRILKHELLELLSQASRFSLACRPHIHGRRFAITRSGHMCLVPPLTRKGDQVWAIENATVPYIFRQRAVPRALSPVALGLMISRFGVRKRGAQARRIPELQIVGNCFAFGLMNGERTICASKEQDRMTWRRRRAILLV